MSFISPNLLPAAPMKRIIVHWTAGSYTASALDKEHYHFVVDGDGRVHAGLHRVSANVAPLREGKYAAHTLSCNTGSIGVSVACMAGAVEAPFNGGKFPLKQGQFERLADVVAELCAAYKIPVSRETVLSHAEVQQTLGIKQRGKWDIAVLPFDRSVVGARAVGDKLREMVKARL